MINKVAAEAMVTRKIIGRWQIMYDWIESPVRGKIFISPRET